MDGILTFEEFEKAVNLALEGCRKIYALQKEALKSKYVSVKEVEE
jgi:exosome complex component RRP41